MKPGIYLIRLREWKVYRLRGIGPKYNRNTIPNSFIFSRIYILMIPLLMVACFANIIYGEDEQNRWSGMIEINEEYFSDDVPKAIPDAGTTTSILDIAKAGTIVDLNVKLNINHESNGNLDIYLIAPDGTRVELFTDVGSISSNFLDTVLDNEAGQPITEGTAPFTNSYRPEGNLADLYGKDINGTWKLEVTDDWGGNTGTLNSWCLIAKLHVKGPVPSPVILSEPSLPGGICDTISWDDVGEICQHETSVAKTIPDEGTITSTLVIDDNGVIEDLNVKVNISHDWDSELDVYLIAPDGTRVELFTDVGGSQDDFVDTMLDNQALQSITEGSAPFTGSYRPEGSLDALIGKNIKGSWVLEVTDDSWFGTGALNSWALTIDKADVLYYAECATDPDFVNVVANSGWMLDRSFTVAELDASQEYWYRAKARPLQLWSQTSQEDFETDTLSDTKATVGGDVMLAGGGGGVLGPEIDIIENPSFETESGWLVGGNSLFVLFGTGYSDSEELWISDGDWAACVIFLDDFWYDEGDSSYFRQTVDWTGVETLVFDYCGILANSLEARIMIGDKEVWSDDRMDGLEDAHYDETINVSEFTGEQDLKLIVEAKRTGAYTAAVFWDNLRTYGAGGSVPSGNIVSTPISLGEDDTWDTLVFNATTPSGTELTLDVLPATGSSPIAGYRNVRSGTDLSGLNRRTIRLRANLSTSDSEATPVLHDWSVTNTDASCESDWSNVESSLPQQ
jgi:subtilisin-like proprotein convertase family protein